MFLLLDIIIEPDVETLFCKIRDHFGRTLQGVIKAVVEKNELEDVTLHLESVYPELEVGLRAVHSYRDLVRFVRHNCFFTSAHMLESLAERFAEDIPEVWRLLARFEKARDELYEQVLAKDFVKEAKERARKLHAKVMFVCHRSYSDNMVLVKVQCVIYEMLAQVDSST